MASRRLCKSSSRRVVEDNVQQVRQPEARDASTNPMLIDSILSNIFGFLDFEDLAQCRSVSKHWHKVSLPTWLAKGPTLKLSLDSHYDVDMTMREFLQLVHHEFQSYGPYEHSGFRQYKKFEVVGNACGQDEHGDLLRFLRICGHDVTELKLDLEIRNFDTYLALMLSPMSPSLVKLSANVRFCNNADVDLREETFELLGEEHRTLTSLQIYYCHANFGAHLSFLPESGWIQLFKRYPNLKSLLLSDGGTPGDLPWFDGVMKTFETLLPVFRNGLLSLETLEMGLGQYTRTETIVEILNSQAATLKKLSLQGVWTLKDFKPPELPLVESLELHGRPIQDLASLSRFQGLKSLYLAIYSVGRSSRLFDQLPQDVLRDTSQSGCIAPTLSKLHCNYGIVKNSLGPEDVRKFACFFPNLTDLHLQLWLDNETLGVVFQSWPGLQHLTIIGARVDDNGISGIVRDFPGMKDLKSLVMSNPLYMRDLYGPTALTGKSLGNFLKLPNLERLEISVHKHPSVGPAVLRQLEQKIKTVKIIWMDEDE